MHTKRARRPEKASARAREWRWRPCAAGSPPLGAGAVAGLSRGLASDPCASNDHRVQFYMDLCSVIHEVTSFKSPLFRRPVRRSVRRTQYKNGISRGTCRPTGAEGLERPAQDAQGCSALTRARGAHFYRRPSLPPVPRSSLSLQVPRRRASGTCSPAARANSVCTLHTPRSLRRLERCRLPFQNLSASTACEQLRHRPDTHASIQSSVPCMRAANAPRWGREYPLPRRRSAC